MRRADDDDGVYFDFSSLYQRPRSEVQDLWFEKLLQAENHVRSNFRVGCIVLSELPEGFAGIPQLQSGWCYVEFLQSTVCQRIVNSKDPSVSEHMIPEWLVGWREKLREPVHKPKRLSPFQKMVERWASQLPAARVDRGRFRGHLRRSEFPIREVPLSPCPCRSRRALAAAPGSPTRNLRGRPRARWPATLGPLLPVVSADTPQPRW